eukprot:TRINITY_DN14434_c0_g1_i1.p1 TRINITY_DN14434_c0_g1~~TRINITY_DN14434_c0_g1_i1.p1  ORF type:complete len:448 (-),score=122.41 TRINITY_DN14434_c0_g1_i1:30-1349(-)
MEGLMLEIQCYILKFLDTRSLLRCQFVCKVWYEGCWTRCTELREMDFTSGEAFRRALGKAGRLEKLWVSRKDVVGLVHGFPSLRTLLHLRIDGASTSAPHLSSFPHLLTLDLRYLSPIRLEGLKHLLHLETLELQATIVNSAEVISEIADLGTLKRLGHSMALEMDQAGLQKHFKGLKGLERLEMIYEPLVQFEWFGQLEALSLVGLDGEALGDLSPLMLSLVSLKLENLDVGSLRFSDFVNLKKLSLSMVSNFEWDMPQQLQTLVVYGCDVDWEGLEALKELRVLKLQFSAEFTEYRSLSKLKNLKKVTLFGDADDNIFLYLPKGLEAVTIEGGPFSDEGLESLAGLKKLKHLEVHSSFRKNGFTDEGLGYLRGLPDIRGIILDGEKITEEGCKVLAQIGSLEFVKILDCDINPSACNHFPLHVNVSLDHKKTSFNAM